MKELNYRTAVRNVRNLYAEVPQEDRENTVNWYLTAHGLIRKIADHAGYRDVETTPLCHVVAALSPGARWSRNLQDFKDLLWYRSENRLSSFRPQTYPAQGIKATVILQRALAGENWGSVLKGPKERAFAHNLAYPEAEQDLTLDFHAFSIAAGTRWAHATVPAFHVGERAAVERAYRQVAKENKLKVHQLQAITWEWWRKTRKAPRGTKSKQK